MDYLYRTDQQVVPEIAMRMGCLCIPDHAGGTFCDDADLFAGVLDCLDVRILRLRIVQADRNADDRGNPGGNLHLGIVRVGREAANHRRDVRSGGAQLGRYGADALLGIAQLVDVVKQLLQLPGHRLVVVLELRSDLVEHGRAADQRPGRLGQPVDVSRLFVECL